MNATLHRRIGFAAWTGLALLQVAWHAWWMPPERMPVALALAITVIPLALPLFALRRPIRALLWVGMLSLFYFCHGVAEMWTSPAERLPALLEILFALMVVTALGVYARSGRGPRSVPLPPGRDAVHGQDLRGGA